MEAFRKAAEQCAGRALPTYEALHRFSVQEPDLFWPLLLEKMQLRVSGDQTPVRTSAHMPDARFFPNLSLNFADNLLNNGSSQDAIRLVGISDARGRQTWTHAELTRAVANMQAKLIALGITSGDRIVGLLPNIPEAIIAMLAATSLGAMWSSCSPDFGVTGIVDRFGQITPRIMFCVDGYLYGDKRFDCIAKNEEIARAVPSIEHVITIALLGDEPTNFSEYIEGDALAPTWPQFPFNHPLYVLYSSGTTGVPKCIVHGQGGTLLQHAKEHKLHCDLKSGDNITYFTTCGWMMWNWLVSALMVPGVTVTLFDGSPGYPDIHRLWKLANDEQITHFGTSPKFIQSCMDHVNPREHYPLDRLRVILSTGSPLLPGHFRWVYDHVKSDVLLSSISGGTDIVSCFCLGNPTRPVRAGEIQALGLGMDVAAFNQHHQPVIGERGELVCRSPFVSMPVFFWNDMASIKYKKSYFSNLEETWFHGDYIALSGSEGEAGGVVIFGRSDATLNPGGVRIGTAEIYRIVEGLDEVEDSLAVGQPFEGDIRIVLFVKLLPGVIWDDALRIKIQNTIRASATPRHVPKIILPVTKIPYTLSGKKVEIAVLQLLTGLEPANTESLADPSALDCYRKLTSTVQSA